MGLWIKNADGTIEKAAGGGGADGADGQPGADGNLWHVGSGDPAPTLGSPGDYYLDGEAGWVWVKRTDTSWTNLYTNLTGPPGGGGGGPHDHDDYLPLEGGTLTGDLQVDGNQPLLLRSVDVAGREYVQFHAGPSAMTMYGGNDANYPNEVRFESNRLLALSIDGTKKVQAHGDLQVDGTITDKNGPVRSFAIAEGIDTADVLERAETATMPVVDDEGVATMDADVESLTVNEVVTALLAKVKQLSARIEALEGQTRL